MPLLEAHIIIYGLIAISCISLAVAGVFIMLEAIDLRRYQKASNYLIHKELERMKNGKDY